MSIVAQVPTGRGHLPLVRLLAVMGGVYTIQNSVGAMMFQGVPTVLRSTGAALDLIGLVSLFMVPWALKFLWSPLIERWRIPARGRQRSRGIVSGGQLAIAGILACLAFVGVDQHVGAVFFGFAIIALIAATVDIAGDGFMIEQLNPEFRGWGNVVQVGGGYAGIMIGTGLFLILVDHAGWRIAVLSMAGIAIVLTMPFLVTPDPRRSDVGADQSRPSLTHAFRRADIRWGLVAMVVCQTGLRMTTVMTGPFLIDNGLSASTIGLLTGTAGTLLCIACIGLTGLAIRRWSARRILPMLLLLQIGCFSLLALSAALPQPPLLLGGLFLAQSAVVAATFVALYTVVMDWTSPHQAGTDFTIFQCSDAFVSVAAGFGAGLIAEHLGFGACFGIAAACAALALLLFPLILRHADRSQENA